MSSLPNPNLHNPYVRLLAIAFSLGVALGSGLGYGFSHAISNTKQQELPVETELRYVSPIKYERLQMGMSLTGVQAILGSGGTEVDRTATTATVVWENPNGYKITATFENGKLKSKKQSRLKPELGKAAKQSTIVEFQPYVLPQGRRKINARAHTVII